jgi:general secretion pathway protein F
MPRFDYTALDASGNARQGRIEAASLDLAEQQLRRKQWLPTTLSAATGPRSADLPFVRWWRRERLSAGQLAVFTRQFATLVSVAPVDQALQALARQMGSHPAAAVLQRVHAAVNEGKRLSDALRAEPQSFPGLYCAAVAAGENAGVLKDVMNRLADLHDRKNEFRSKIIVAMVYPAILFVVALAVVTGLLVFVVPQIVEQFASMNQALPLLTRIMIDMSDGLRSWGWLIALSLLIGALIGGQLLRRPDLRLRFDRWLLDVPLIGPMLRGLGGARLARTLGMLLDNGVPLVDALRLSEATLGNRAQCLACQRATTAVREGASLATALRREALFPPLLDSVIASGESSGKLGLLLESAAGFLERDFETVTRAGLSILEPAIIVVMGGLVTLIVLAILLPILQLNTLAFA